MGKLITIGQTLLDGLKWLMEGNNWLFLTPLVLICGYVFIQMARKKEKLLIFMACHIIDIYRQLNVEVIY